MVPKRITLPIGFSPSGKSSSTTVCPHQTHLGGYPNILIGKGFAVGHPVAANLEVVEIDPVDRRRRIVRSVHRLSGTVDRRRHVADIAGLVPDIFKILQLERFHVVRIQPHAAPHVTARMIMIMFEPISLISAWMLFFEPWPMASMVMTEATPMMMPNMVRNPRSLLLLSALTANLE